MTSKQRRYSGGIEKHAATTTTTTDAAQEERQQQKWVIHHHHHSAAAASSPKDGNVKANNLGVTTMRKKVSTFTLRTTSVYNLFFARIFGAKFGYNTQRLGIYV